MRLARFAAGIGLGTLAVAGLFLAPALQAQESGQTRSAKRAAPARVGGIGIFTPAAADPQLAATLSRLRMPDPVFRFTPTDSRRPGSRAVTVAVRARSTRTALAAVDRTALPTNPGLAPVAYNLGVSVGWKRFAVSGDMTRVDLVTEPGSRERNTVGLSYSGKRAAGRVQATADRPLTNTPIVIGDKPSYSIDVGGSFSLTRNVDVTAGVRYKSEVERERLPRLTDNRRDSQSVYVGTAFRF